ncbi:hypothetical protein BD309DRAFT_161509 [Dichomitus squalens]|nr:hypothetical protein BD309DRAFT_161509 [Dichomitus squalens]
MRTRWDGLMRNYCCYPAAWRMLLLSRGGVGIEHECCNPKPLSASLVANHPQHFVLPTPDDVSSVHTQPVDRWPRKTQGRHKPSGVLTCRCTARRHEEADHGLTWAG